jgi:hypothetical protein
MNFALDVSKFRDKAMNQANTVIRKTGLEVGRRIIMRTPVGNPELWASPAPKGYVGGRARGNWIPTIGTSNSNEIDTVDKSGAKTVASIAGTVRQWKPSTGISLFITNNVPYIEVLEKGRIGNQGSRQAPNGMVAITVAEFQNIVDASIRGI